MAKVTNAFATVQARGNREDLENTIYNIDPFDTPLFTLAGRRGVSNILFDWQTEALPAVDLANKREEGFTLARQAGTATTRISNVCQISERDATVTGTQEEANAAGKPSGEMAHQMALKAKALKRDMESIACGNQVRIDGNPADESIARQTRGLEHFITTNVSYGAGGANGADQYTALTDGTIRNFTEALLGDVMQTAYENGAEPGILLLGPYAKRVFSTFSGRDSSQVSVGKTEVVATVDIYASDFGRIRAMPTRWSRPRTALLLDPSYVKIAFYRSFRTVPIARIGDAETKMILAEWGLHVGNERAHAKIADIPYSRATDPDPDDVVGG